MGRDRSSMNDFSTSLDAVLILVGAVITSTLYAAGLNRVQERYTPNWTWLTVVGGTALT